MHRRLLVLVVLAFIAGIICGRYTLPNFLFFLGGAALALLMAGLLWRKSVIIGQVLLLSGILCLGASSYLSARLPVAALYDRSGDWDYVQGTVVNYPTHGIVYSSFSLKPHASPGYLRVFYFHSSKGAHGFLRIGYGDELRLYAPVEQPEDLKDFDYREYLLRRGIWGVVKLWSSKQVRVIAADRANPLLRLGYQLRERIFQWLDEWLPEKQGGMLKALLFGDRGYLSKGIEEQFRDAGVAHVLAVSGLHLGILISLLVLLLKALRLSPGRIYLTALPSVAFYLLLVGFRISLVRAALLFLFLALGWLLSEWGWILRRWADPYQGLSAAALVILGWNPQALFDVSFQLSFSATLGIVVFARFFERTLYFLEPRWLRGLIAVSLAAQLGVIPFIAWHFQRVYLLVILANLLVIPLVTLVLWGGVALVGFGLLFPSLAGFLGRGESWLLGSLESITRSLASLRLSYLEVQEFTIVLAGYLPILSMFLVLAWRAKLRRAR